jgi:hypothetical protein
MPAKAVPLSVFLSSGSHAAAEEDALPTAPLASSAEGGGKKYVVEWSGDGPLPLPPDVVQANINNRTFTASNKLFAKPPATLEEFKVKIAELILEFFDSNCVMEVVRQLEELQMPRTHGELVRRAILLSLDRSDREREMVAVLISSLHVRRIISSTQVFNAFLALLESAADIILDVPAADGMLAHFLADAALDGCLTPTFILEPPPLSIKLTADQRAVADRILAEAARRLHDGTALAAPSAALSVPLSQVKATIESFIAEYLQVRRARSGAWQGAKRARGASHRHRARAPRAHHCASASTSPARAPRPRATPAQAADLGEVSRRLREGQVHLPLRHEVVKRGVRVAMQRGPQECESISRLISALYGGTLPACEISRGFEALIEEAADLALDVPTADRLLGNFLARAVSDEVVPANFVELALRTKAGGDDAGVAALRRAKALVAISHNSHRMARIWGPRATAASASVDEVKKMFQDIVDEFFTSSDGAEARRALDELSVPAYHHEFCKKLLRRAVEGTRAERELTLTLLVMLSSGEEPTVSTDALAQGFERLTETLSDLSLDAPHAPATLASLRAEAKAKGVVSC